MEKATNGWTLGELASILNGDLRGAPTLVIKRPALSDADDPEGLAFAESDEYVVRAENSRVGAVLVPLESRPIEKPHIRVEKPREAFAHFLQICQRPMALNSGIHKAAVVEESATVHETASVGAFAVVERGAVIGPKARIYPFAYIGEDCVIGEGAQIYPHAVLYREVEVGAETTIHAGAVIGADGFGYTWNGSEHVKIQQVGRTIIGSHVEVGACTTVDRAMLGETNIGEGTKIDNLVQIGHNTRIGKHTIIAAQAGVSGSTIIGDRCVLAGQTATADHVRIGDDITLTGRAAASKDLTAPGFYRGAPASPFREQLRTEAGQRKIPDLLNRLRELEARLEKLEQGQ